MARLRLHPTAVVAAVLLASGIVVVWQAAGPSGRLLVSSDEAWWIWQREPPSARGRAQGPRAVVFRLRAFLAIVPPEAPAQVESLGRHRLSLNGRELAGEVVAAGVREIRRVDLAPGLVTGSNELRVEVESRGSPPALRLDGLDALSTGAAWEVSPDGRFWEPASPVWERGHLPLNRALDTPGALRRSAPWLLAFFVAGCLACVVATRERAPAFPPGRALLEPSRLRAIAMLAWLALAANNLARLPVELGFDVLAHYEYAAFLLREGRVPFAHEGLQMFQPPLFYLLAAGWQAAVAWLASDELALRSVRLLPMLCGVAQVEIGYRSARLVYPERPDLQRLVIALAGFLPVSLYMSQSVGNEPLSALLTSAMLLACLKSIAEPGLPLGRAFLGVGLLLGLALLAKVTALLLAPAVGAVLVAVARRRGRSARQTAGLVGRLVAVAVAVAGGYYLRNWWVLGRPFVGGWDPTRGMAWSQDPGFRVPSDLLRFGEALVHPVRTLGSLWDGLYSTLWLDGALSGMLSPLPPWSYDAMLSLAPLSLPMTLALLAGLARASRRPTDASRLALGFAALCVVSLVAGIAFLFLQLPTWSTAKSSYALGALPCLALLVAWGFEPLLRTGVGRVLVSGYVCCWAAAGLVSFWAG